MCRVTGEELIITTRGEWAHLFISLYKYSKEEKDKKFLNKFFKSSTPAYTFDVETDEIKQTKRYIYNQSQKEFETKIWNQMHALILKHRKLLSVEALITNKPELDNLVNTWLDNYKPHLAYTIWLFGRI